MGDGSGSRPGMWRQGPIRAAVANVTAIAVKAFLQAGEPECTGDEFCCRVCGTLDLSDVVVCAVFEGSRVDVHIRRMGSLGGAQIEVEVARIFRGGPASLAQRQAQSQADEILQLFEDAGFSFQSL